MTAMARSDGSLRIITLVAIGGVADMNGRVASAESVEIDPKPPSPGPKNPDCNQALTWSSPMRYAGPQLVGRADAVPSSDAARVHDAARGSVGFAARGARAAAVDTDDRISPQSIVRRRPRPIRGAASGLERRRLRRGSKCGDRIPLCGESLRAPASSG